jgi:hypothetical protein
MHLEGILETAHVFELATRKKNVQLSYDAEKKVLPVAMPMDLTIWEPV